MTKRGIWIVLLVALCLLWPLSRVVRQQARLAQACPAGYLHNTQGYCEVFVDPYAQPTQQAGYAVAQCPVGFTPNPNKAGDCIPAAGYVPLLPQNSGTQQAIEEQTRVLRQVQQDQVNADLAQRQRSDNN